MEKLLNQLLADLMAINVNLHNLHWNVSGMGFEEYHELTEGLYNDVFSKFDDVAEYLKSNDMYPSASLDQYAKETKCKPLAVKDFTDEEVVASLNDIYTYLIKSFQEIANKADKEGHKGLVFIMTNWIGEYKKAHWMIKARLK
ncbi:Dps family protein [Mycoplasma sp. P36-A1]|uniref:Dps family protein n=1 Tax=Mycoplasma sp. P36-A1 TaxID=3252900 RepID=UPI003C2BCE42